jgi:GT2 family glycosyltransferase
MNKAAIVILNWNGIDYLRKFLPILVAHTPQNYASFYVADNGSTDSSIDWLMENMPEIEVISLKTNHGFAEGYNLALQQIEASYFVLLNSDVEVTENWLEPLYKMMEENKDIAACMPKIKSYDDPSRFEYAGAAGGFIDKYGFPFCRGRIFYHIEEDTGQYDQPADIFWASGACLMVRSEIYFRAGGLDPYFFAHMEEIDLCWRIKNLGHRICFNPASTVLHIGGGTLPKKNHKKTYYNFRNNLILLIKNLPRTKYRRTLIKRTLLDIIAAGYFLAKLDFGEFMAVVKAYLSVLGHLKEILHSRKVLKERIRPGYHPEIYEKSVVFKFFVIRLRTYREIMP